MCLALEWRVGFLERQIAVVLWWAEPQVHGSTDVVIKDIVPTGSYEFN